MPTRIPGTGAALTSAVEWETLLEHLERIRAAVAAGSDATERLAETIHEHDAALGVVQTRIRGLETIVTAPTWQVPEGAPRPGLLAALETLDARVAQLERATGEGAATLAEETAALTAIVKERVKAQLCRQVEDIHIAVHRPGQRPRQVGTGLASQVAEIERALLAQGETLGRWQGGAASVSGALAAVCKQVAALERQHQAVAAVLERLETAQRASGDQVARLLVQQQARLDGNDALTLLARLLSSPGEVAPLFRRDQFVCFTPERVQRWLVDKGLSRREAEHVRSVWRDAGYVPSERKDNHNKRVKIAGAKSPPYFMVVPTLTYAKLRVPVPPELPTEPPANRAPGSAG